MDLTTTNMAVCVAALLIGSVVGYLWGARRGKNAKREMRQILNAQSVELLEAKAETRKLSKYLGEANRKDRLLKLTLKRLKVSNQTVKILQKVLDEIDRKHFIDMSRLNVTTVESRVRAKRAALVAREASFRLRLLERALPQLQTISAPEPKSYGQGDPVTVSVVDKHTPATRKERANAVSNRDLHRLTALKSSNEQVLERSSNTVNFPPTPAASKDKQIEPQPIKNERKLSKNGAIKRAP